MSASASEHSTSGPHPLLPGASPATIRDRLLPEDRERFLRGYRNALSEAQRSLELEGVQTVVEQWRRIALAQSDPVGFRQAVRAAAAIFEGEPSPEDEAFEVTRIQAGM